MFAKRGCKSFIRCIYHTYIHKAIRHSFRFSIWQLPLLRWQLPLLLISYLVASHPKRSLNIWLLSINKFHEKKPLSEYSIKSAGCAVILNLNAKPLSPFVIELLLLLSLLHTLQPGVKGCRECEEQLLAAYLWPYFDCSRQAFKHPTIHPPLQAWSMVQGPGSGNGSRAACQDA